MAARKVTKIALILAAAVFDRGVESRADEGQSDNISVPKYFSYPKGKDVAEVYSDALNGPWTSTGFSAGSDLINPADSMSALYRHPSTSRLHDRGCVLLPYSSAQALSSDVTSLTGVAKIVHTFGYRLLYNGVPFSKHTSQSLVVAVQGEQRAILFTRERNLPDPDNLPSTEAAVRLDEATSVGLSDATRAVHDIDLEIAAGGRAVAPRLEIVVGAGKANQALLTWTFAVLAKNRKDRFVRQYWVAASGDPKVVQKEDLVYGCYQTAPGGAGSGAGASAATASTATGNIYAFRKSPRSAADRSKPLHQYLAEKLPGGGEVWTDVHGQFLFVPGGDLNTHLVGQFARVFNEGGKPLLANKDGNNNLVFDAIDEDGLAQVSAFYWVSFAHEFVRPFLARAPTRLGCNPVHVNINDTCNAFWSGDDNSLNFFKSGGGCVNSAYCDVVCHEFGHGVDAEFDDIRDAAYSEGFGDSLAILITQSSIVGRDFFGLDKPMRDASKAVMWPDVKDDFDPHVTGQPFAGFTWELTRRLLATFNNDEKKAFDVAKQLTLGAASLNPSDIPNAVRLTFYIDSQNGSRYFNQLADAADSRKIPRPNDRRIAANPKNLNQRE